jgi:hypothetical protein
MTPKLNELMSRVAAEDAEREREEQKAAEAWQARQAALIAEAQTLVGEVLGPCRIEPADEGIDTFTVTPDLWRGLVTLRVWRVMDKWFCDHGYSPGGRADWNDPEAARFLVEMHRRFEERLVATIDWRQQALGATLLQSVVAESLAQLLALAPERDAEWRALAEAARARIAQREAAMDAYVAALAAWRADYEAALTDNRQALDEIRSFADQEFYRYEVAYAAVDDDDEADGVGRYVEMAWAADPTPDEKGYWALYVDGRVVRRKLLRALWVGEVVIETVSEAGRGPWRATVYAPDAGESVACLAQVAGDIRSEVNGRMRRLPAEPSPGRFGLGGSEWTAEERQRVNDVTAGMARADIPF